MSEIDGLFFNAQQVLLLTSGDVKKITYFYRFIFMRESSDCFQRVLAIAILSVCLSVCLSHGWISQKRCKLGSPNLQRQRQRIFSDSYMYTSEERGTPTRGSVLSHREVNWLCRRPIETSTTQGRCKSVTIQSNQ